MQEIAQFNIASGEEVLVEQKWEYTFRPCGPYFTYDYHGLNTGEITATKKISLLQILIDTIKPGMAIAGDLNHIGIYRKYTHYI